MLTEWFEQAGAIIGAIGTDEFAGTLSSSLKVIADFDFTVIFGYRGRARPLDLYDDFPKAKRRIMVEDYQEGPYMLDPFYLACGDTIESNLYRMKDVAPDRFYQGEYFRSYYKRTGLAEEICYLIDLSDGTFVCVSLMRANRVFSAREFRDLRKAWPVVREACSLHWRDLASRFGLDGEHSGSRGRENNVSHAFQTFDGGLLTPREKEVAEFTLKGHSAEAVGRILGITPGTVRIHRRNIYSKLRIRSQGELFSRFIAALLGPGARAEKNQRPGDSH